MSYKYESPIDRGYKRFYLSRRLHNQLFPLYKTRWYRSYEYYWSEHDIRIDVFVSNLGIALETFGFPVNILLNGLMNTKEIFRSIRKLYGQKESGSFYSWNIWNDSETYRKVMEVVNYR